MYGLIYLTRSQNFCDLKKKNVWPFSCSDTLVYLKLVNAWPKAGKHYMIHQDQKVVILK